MVILGQCYGYVHDNLKRHEGRNELNGNWTDYGQWVLVGSWTCKLFKPPLPKLVLSFCVSVSHCVFLLISVSFIIWAFLFYISLGVLCLVAFFLFFSMRAAVIVTGTANRSRDICCHNVFKFLSLLLFYCLFVCLPLFLNMSLCLCLSAFVNLSVCLPASVRLSVLLPLCLSLSCCLCVCVCLFLNESLIKLKV